MVWYSTMLMIDAGWDLPFEQYLAHFVCSGEGTCHLSSTQPIIYAGQYLPFKRYCPHYLTVVSPFFNGTVPII
jgi:hypothetical protein